MNSFRSAALVLLVIAGQIPAQAAPPSNRQRWDLTLFSWVRRSPAEPGAPANSQPLRVSAAALEQALASVQLVLPKEDEPLFDRSEAAGLSKVLAEALALAGPGEDLELVSTAKRGGGFFSDSLTVTARLFVQEGKLNLLVHDARLDVVFKYNLDFTMPKFEFGSRTKARAVVLRAEEGEARRPDWIVLPLPPPTVKAAPTSTPVTVAPTPVAPSPVLPAAVAPVAPAAPAPPRPESAPAPSSTLESRLFRLKQLRDQNLITEEDYAKRKQELLKEL